MNTSLEQLKILVVNFDDESKEHVRLLERQLEEALAKDNLSEHIAIQDFRKGLESEIRAIDALLTTQYSKEFPDRERDRLLDKKALYNRFIETFGGSAVKPVENTIKQYLDNARTY